MQPRQTNRVEVHSHICREKHLLGEPEWPLKCVCGCECGKVSEGPLHGKKSCAIRNRKSDRESVGRGGLVVSAPSLPSPRKMYTASLASPPIASTKALQRGRRPDDKALPPLVGGKDHLPPFCVRKHVPVPDNAAAALANAAVPPGGSSWRYMALEKPGEKPGEKPADRAPPDMPNRAMPWQPWPLPTEPPGGSDATTAVPAPAPARSSAG